MDRYAALMLFQFRTDNKGVINKRRVCEERIIIFEADDSEIAHKMAEMRGLEEEHSYSDNGINVFFEFVGIIELIELGECLDKDEVWWRMVEKVNPMENRDKLIPEKCELLVFNQNRGKKRLTVP